MDNKPMTINIELIDGYTISHYNVADIYRLEDTSEIYIENTKESGLTGTYYNMNTVADIAVIA